MKLLYADATPRTLELFTKIIFGMWAVIALIDPLPELQHLPLEFFHPLGLVLRAVPESLHPLLLTGPFLWGLKGALLVSILCVLAGRFRLFALVAACFLLTAEQSLIRSFGHVNHAELGLLYAAYCITFFAIADRLTGERKPAVPIVAFLFFFFLSYTFIGTYRLVYGGWPTFTTGRLTYWITYNTYDASFYSMKLGALVLQYPWLNFLLNAGLPVITFFEILAPFTLLSNRFRLLFLIVIVPFHLFNFLFMDILFLENLILIVLLLAVLPSRAGAKA
jgi:hypothetical protein